MSEALDKSVACTEQEFYDHLTLRSIFYDKLTCNRPTYSIPVEFLMIFIMPLLHHHLTDGGFVRLCKGLFAS